MNVGEIQIFYYYLYYSLYSYDFTSEVKTRALI